MPPILTGGRPLLGNGDINAPACAIVKWQPVYTSIHNDPMTRAAPHAWNVAHRQFRTRAPGGAAPILWHPAHALCCFAMRGAFADSVACRTMCAAQAKKN
jgi:hypothetical protein